MKFRGPYRTFVRIRDRIWVSREDKYDHNWKEYYPIIKEYNRRNLTLDGDITRAFAGIVELIGSHTKQSFYFGLPCSISRCFGNHRPLIRDEDLPGRFRIEDSLYPAGLGWAGNVI